jgi:hypothetical protein
MAGPAVAAGEPDVIAELSWAGVPAPEVLPDATAGLAAGPGNSS